MVSLDSRHRKVRDYKRFDGRVSDFNKPVNVGNSKKWEIEQFGEYVGIHDGVNDIILFIGGDATCNRSKVAYASEIAKMLKEYQTD